MQTYAVLASLALRDKPLDPNDVKPGYVALGIVVLLIIATAILCVSFLRHAKKAQEPWEADESDPGVRRTTPHDRS